jgi:hypothetical protein
MAARHSGEEAVRQMIEGFARENADEGGAVRLRNVFRYILARA